MSNFYNNLMEIYLKFFVIKMMLVNFWYKVACIFDTQFFGNLMLSLRTSVNWPLDTFNNNTIKATCKKTKQNSCSHKFFLLLLKPTLNCFAFVVMFSKQIFSVKLRDTQLCGSIYEARQFVLLSLKLRDLPNHQGASFRTLDIFGKLWMSRGARTWFGLRLFGAMVWRVVGIDY